MPLGLFGYTCHCSQNLGEGSVYVCMWVCMHVCIWRQSCLTYKWMGKYSMGGLAPSLIIITEMGLKAVYLKGINQELFVTPWNIAH